MCVGINMDGRTRYNKVTNVLRPIVGQKIHLYKLRRRIMIDIGSSEEVVGECVGLMINLCLIREVDHLIFKIERCEADI